MAPNLLGNSALFLAEATTTEEPVPQVINRTTHRQNINAKQSSKLGHPRYRWQIVWRNVLAFAYLHTAGLYGLYLLVFACTGKTFLWCYLVALFGGQGITAGAHRLWAHRSYKAKLPLRIILMILQTAAFQNHIYEWVRDHRVHHKFTDTDADPHNAQRGFFFSHIGWLMVKKHKDVMIKGKTVDMSDLEADPVVMFQKKFYLVLVPIFCFAIPVLVPWYFWGENIWNCWFSIGMFRYAISLHFTWLVNSAAHIWGTKPYDKTIGPTENLGVAIAAFGEGWHNYHHVFPWDYKAAELGNYKVNPTTMILDGLSKIGWAYDLKTVSVDMVKKRVKRTGDGTRVFNDETSGNGDSHNHHHHHGGIWGWGDKDMKEEDIKDVEIYNRLTES
ncbi:hypothetical protein ILUMI_26282 [Ignelater luminosus]|uniref:Uncharacterized protein n=1 Tax=Ignelater luminosus TaxID=2038154 RepID=A0A8K0C6S9_IGNLU|nr:hypothetical protein ILUMI_26282 [Ignelater luminosus]